MDMHHTLGTIGLDPAESPVDVSIVLPAYNEADCVDGMYRQVTGVLDGEDVSYEIVFIDDGSTDATWVELQKLAARDHRVRALRHRRNFGKASALANGFSFARGHVVVTSDADMQYDPNDMLRLIEKVQEGYQVVSAYKVIRRDALSRRLASKFFNFFVRNTTGIQLHDFNAGLKAYHHSAAQDLIPYGYGELHRFFVLLAARRGYTVAEVPVESVPRPTGKSKYGLERYVRGALDYLTAFFLAGYMERPLHLLGSTGLTMSALGIGVFGYLGYLALVAQQSISNRPLLTVGVLLVLSGLQLIVVGLIAEMMNHLDRGERNPAKISQVLGVERRTTRLNRSLAPLVDRRRGTAEEDEPEPFVSRPHVAAQLGGEGRHGRHIAEGPTLAEHT